MFPYPSGTGLHVGHPLGFIGTDVLGRYLRMTGHNVLHAMGFDAFGLPAEQYAVQTGTHPRSTTENNVRRYQEQLRRLGLGARRPPLGVHHRRRVLPLDAVDLPADLQLLVRRGAAPGPADRRAGGRAGRRHPAHPRRSGLVGAEPARAARGGRLAPAGLRLRGPGELVPGPGHGAGQRGGHRRRAQRARQLPGVPAQPEAVDDADHRVRRPAGRRPGPAGLAGLGEGHAAQLDRPLRGRQRHVPGRRRGTAASRCSPPARTPCSAPPTWCWPRSTRWSSGSPRRPGRPASTRAGPAAPAPRPRRWPATGTRPRASPSWTGRRTRTRPASSPGPTRSTRSTASRSRCSWPTTC